MHLLPITKLGKWSVGFTISFLVFLMVLMLMAASGQTGGETFSDNLLLAIPGFVAGGSAIVAFIIGIIAIWQQKERSWPVYVAVIIGLLATIFIVSEFDSTH